MEQVMDDESEEKKLTRIGIAWLLFGPKVANSNNVYQAFITNFEELCWELIKYATLFLKNKNKNFSGLK